MKAYLLTAALAVVGCGRVAAAEWRPQAPAPAEANPVVVPEQRDDVVVAPTCQVPQAGSARTRRLVGKSLLHFEDVIGEKAGVIEESDLPLRTEYEVRETVLDADDRRVQALRVEYIRHRDTDDHKTTVHPVETKTYVVRRDGKSVIVTYANGGAPSQEEKRILTRDFHAFVGHPFARIAGSRLRTGDTLAEISDHRTRYVFKGRARPALSAGNADALVFEVEDAEHEEQGVRVTRTGTYVIRESDCALLQYRAVEHGRKFESGQREGVTYSRIGTGTLNVESTLSYDRP